MFSAKLIMTIVIISRCNCGPVGGLTDFGGDYSEYLNLLKGNDVLDDFGGGGLDDIEDGQARQEAVMGGEEDELKDGFLRSLTLKKKKDGKDVHLHFDVNVLVLNNRTSDFKPTLGSQEPNLADKMQFLERDSNKESSTGDSGAEPFDWKKMQGGGTKPWESKPGGQTGGGASGGWEGKTGGGGQTGGQAGKVPQAVGVPPTGGIPPSAGGQAGNTGQKDVEKDRETRGMGGKWMRGNIRTLPKQMVVILSPKKEVFDEVTTMLEDAVDKGNKSLIFDIIRKIQKEQMKSMNKKKTRINKDGLDFKRETDDAKEMKDAITNIVDSFVATYDDPMVITTKLPTPYHNLTITGLSSITICSISKPAHTWKFSICPDRLSATVSITTGPSMPFTGKVTAIYKNPELHLTMSHTKEMLRMSSIKISSDSLQFYPAFDSAVPLNPWSKVSLGGYMMARAKKVLGKLVEKVLIMSFKELE